MVSTWLKWEVRACWTGLNGSLMAASSGEAPLDEGWAEAAEENAEALGSAIDRAKGMLEGAVFVDAETYGNHENLARHLTAIRRLQKQVEALKRELWTTRRVEHAARSAQEDLEGKLQARESTIEAIQQEKQAYADSLHQHALALEEKQRQMDRLKEELARLKSSTSSSPPNPS